jgi:hypothetical protein
VFNVDTVIPPPAATFVRHLGKIAVAARETCFCRGIAKQQVLRAALQVLKGLSVFVAAQGRQVILICGLEKRPSLEGHKNQCRSVADIQKLGWRFGIHSSPRDYL